MFQEQDRQGRVMLQILICYCLPVSEDMAVEGGLDLNHDDYTDMEGTEIHGLIRLLALVG